MKCPKCESENLLILGKGWNGGYCYTCRIIFDVTSDETNNLVGKYEEPILESR